MERSSMKNIIKHSRRNFLKTSVALSGASLINSPLLSSVGNPETGENSLKENYTFLFQGDSITDGNRTRDNDWNHLMSHSY